ncbi:MAG: hypothetical protein ACUVTH_14110 [Thermogutta sp.]
MRESANRGRKSKTPTDFAVATGKREGAFCVEEYHVPPLVPREEDEVCLSSRGDNDHASGRFANTALDGGRRRGAV